MNCLVRLPVPEQVFSFPFASRVVGGGDVLEKAIANQRAQAEQQSSLALPVDRLAYIIATAMSDNLTGEGGTPAAESLDFEPGEVEIARRLESEIFRERQRRYLPRRNFSTKCNYFAIEPSLELGATLLEADAAVVRNLRDIRVWDKVDAVVAAASADVSIVPGRTRLETRRLQEEEKQATLDESTQDREAHHAEVDNPVVEAPEISKIGGKIKLQPSNVRVFEIGSTCATAIGQSFGSNALYARLQEPDELSGRGAVAPPRHSLVAPLVTVVRDSRRRRRFNPDNLEPAAKCRFEALSQQQRKRAYLENNTIKAPEQETVEFLSALESGPRIRISVASLTLRKPIQPGRGAGVVITAASVMSQSRLLATFLRRLRSTAGTSVVIVFVKGRLPLAVEIHLTAEMKEAGFPIVRTGRTRASARLVQATDTIAIFAHRSEQLTIRALDSMEFEAETKDSFFQKLSLALSATPAELKWNRSAARTARAQSRRKFLSGGEKSKEAGSAEPPPPSESVVAATEVKESGRIISEFVASLTIVPENRVMTVAGLKSNGDELLTSMLSEWSNTAQSEQPINHEEISLFQETVMRRTDAETDNSVQVAAEDAEIVEVPPAQEEMEVETPALSDATLSKEKLKALQSEDDVLGPIMRLLETMADGDGDYFPASSQQRPSERDIAAAAGKLPWVKGALRADKFVLASGVLLRTVEHSASFSQGVAVVVPKSAVPLVLFIGHNHILAGHPGVHKTM